MSLRDKTISGMFWSLLQNVGGRGISFVVFIVLARLLTPEIFGLIGMLAIFIQISHVLIQAGFNEALIQKKDTDEEDYSSVFWINLVISLLIYCALYFAAPLIADFYSQPVLTELTRALSLVFVINAFSFVQTARLQKKMNFKTLTIIHIPSTLIGGGVAVGMAVMGFGVWSLVALQLVARGAYAIQIWIHAKWKPMFVFNTAKAKGLFSFGSKLMISSIIHALFSNAYLVVIGKFFPLSYVGYYQTSRKLVITSSKTFIFSLRRVVFPAFSTIQDDNEQLKKGFRKVMQQVLFWLCPALVLAGVLAEPLFQFVLTEKWLPAVPYFQIFCVIGLIYPMYSFHINIINVKGRSDLYLKITIVSRILSLFGIVGGVLIGIWALLIFQAVQVVIEYFIWGFYGGRFINYPIPEQLKDVLAIFVLSFIVGCIVYFLNAMAGQLYAWVRLLLGFIIGGGIYFLIAKKLKLDPYNDFRDILEKRLSIFLSRNGNKLK